MKELAQIDFGTFKGFGPLGTPQGTGIDIFSTIISSAIGVMTIVAFIWFVFQFIIGAIGIMTAGGDKQKLEGSRTKIVNGIIGLVVVIMAIAIISLIGFLFNIPFLNLPSLFNQISGGGTSTATYRGGTNFLK